MGVKVTTVAAGDGNPGRPRVQGLFVLFGEHDMSPTLAVDAAALTALRTPAVSAVATRYLAGPNAHRLVVFGTGPQAEGHALAMTCVRDIDDLAVVGRTEEATQAFVERLRAQGLPARAASQDAVSEADIVCTCTSSSTPVFSGARLASVVHVNAVGTHEPDSRELDDDAFSGASVVVESRSAASREAGDVILARRSGAIPPRTAIRELSQVVRRPRRRSGRTIFKSVGTAGQDLVVGQMLLEQMRQGGAASKSPGLWLVDPPQR